MYWGADLFIVVNDTEDSYDILWNENLYRYSKKPNFFNKAVINTNVQVDAKI